MIYFQLDIPSLLTPSKTYAREFMCSAEKLACDQSMHQVSTVNKWFTVTSCGMLMVDLFWNLVYRTKLLTTIGWRDTQASPRPVATFGFFIIVPYSSIFPHKIQFKSNFWAAHAIATIAAHVPLWEWIISQNQTPFLLWFVKEMMLLDYQIPKIH